MAIRARYLASALLASFALLSPLSAHLLDASCSGCTGQTAGAGGNLAPPPCTTGIWADWEISITVEIDDGSCELDEGVGYVNCLGYPCKTTVTYIWGAEVADSDLTIGYYENGKARETMSEILFIGEPPWTPGKFGYVSFDTDNSPTLRCGSGFKFYISGNSCGPFTAEVYAQCSMCTGSLAIPEGSSE